MTVYSWELANKSKLAFFYRMILSSTAYYKVALVWCVTKTPHSLEKKLIDKDGIWTHLCRAHSSKHSSINLMVVGSRLPSSIGGFFFFLNTLCSDLSLSYFFVRPSGKQALPLPVNSVIIKVTIQPLCLTHWLHASSTHIASFLFPVERGHCPLSLWHNGSQSW